MKTDPRSAAHVLAIAERIKPILAGHDPEIQGAILAELTALWLAGIAPQLRQAIWEISIEHIGRLVAVNENELFGPAGHPAGKDSLQ